MVGVTLQQISYKGVQHVEHLKIALSWGFIIRLDGPHHKVLFLNHTPFELLVKEAELFTNPRKYVRRPK